MRRRERVLMALSHEVPDRCPMQFTPTAEFAQRLGDQLGQTLREQDIALAHVGWVTSYGGTENEYVDEWGVGFKRVPYQTRFGAGYYSEICHHPLTADAAIDSYRSPDPNRDSLYAHAAHLLERYKDEYYIVGAVLCTIFETAWALRGLEQMLLDFVANADLANRILDIPHRYHLVAVRRLAEMGVDMIWLGDDVGSQKSLLMSPKTWRRFLKGRLAESISTAKGINTDIKVAYHSDGVITPIIPDLIEIGLDVLNPVQPLCMDPAELKREYGDRLCFWGTIDEQQTLPFGTPADVREEVLTRLRTAGKGGGLIIGPTHNVQLDVPLENFWAMVEAIRGTPYASLS